MLNKIFKIPPEAVPEGRTHTLPVFGHGSLLIAVNSCWSSGLLKKNQRSPEEEDEMEEHAALSVLQRWGEMKEFLPGALPLVPEHVEIRSLWNQDKPGLPQVQTVAATRYMRGLY